MIEINSKITPGTTVEVLGQLRLPYEQRQKRWLRARLASGQPVALKLRRGETLRAGDLLAAPDGRAIEVVAAAEKVLHVECSSVRQLARAAYHLGNRHAAVQLGHGFLRIIEDAVLEQMLNRLGAKITKMEAPFEPETGAYGDGDVHPSESARAEGERGHESPLTENGTGQDDRDRNHPRSRK